jgi:hypothetical protein
VIEQGANNKDVPHIVNPVFYLQNRNWQIVSQLYQAAVLLEVEVRSIS